MHQIAAAYNFWLVTLSFGLATLTSYAAVCQRKREKALRASELVYRSMFDEALVGMFTVGPDGHLLVSNKAMAAMLGYADAEELLAATAQPLWARAVSREQGDALMAALKAAGHVKCFELEIFRRDGSKVWIAANVRARSLHGAPFGFTGSFEDITECRRSREQALQSQKLESVGQLAAGIAHEINTPAQYIGDNVRFLADSFAALMTLNTGYARLLAAAESAEVTAQLVEQTAHMVAKADVPYLLEEIPKALEQTLVGISQVSALVKAMKEFAQPGTEEKALLDLNRAIENTVAVARNEWKYVADMQLNLDATLPLVCCLPGDVHQMVLNLILNAAHAIEDVVASGATQKGLITIATRSVAGCVEVSISDTGTGIPEALRSRIFDPFFTTRKIGKGTGQGLAIARSVAVDRHQGTIELETEVGQGTSFIVRLPSAGIHSPHSEKVAA